MKQRIGIIGGLGNEAMVDLVNKIASYPNHVEHEYVVFGNSRLAYKPEEVAQKWLPTDLPELRKYDTALYTLRLMQHLGTTAMGLACNSAHELFRDIVSDIPVPFIDMLKETAATEQGQTEDILVMGVTSLMESGLYQQALAEYGVPSFSPSTENQPKVMDAIYNSEFGVKTAQITPQAEQLLCDVITDEASRSSFKKVVLGCTELPLVLTPANVARFKANGMIPDYIDVIDASMVLATKLANAKGQAFELDVPMASFRRENLDWFLPFAIEVTSLSSIAEVQNRIFALTAQYAKSQNKAITGSYAHLPTLFFSKEAIDVKEKLIQLDIELIEADKLTDERVLDALAQHFSE
ncbi:aspartate/glutamate racemase family protein [Enterovibrio sp. ZSDZ35]|uniref:Aspartate/glutamate racemase family protein n=1 Tax=Enterovibrio qingdaonensis TaxID=2899818 RepID=A0ABT5QNT3_9GAMM|nr:aspartate/glutamate racemase family protein [Enterovibrio sp. ZSDZ35]MDD1782612.1 aspartate/glutamate racemase family protein [Enterovibrio sp. ZSDZ35]